MRLRLIVTSRTGQSETSLATSPVRPPDWQTDINGYVRKIRTYFIVSSMSYLLATSNSLRNAHHVTYRTLAFYLFSFFADNAT